MRPRTTARRTLLGHDVAVAYAVLAALYLIRVIEFQPIQIPAYLLIVTYDVVEAMLPVLAPYHPVGFPLFLYALAVLGAGLSRRFGAETGAVAWTRAFGGILLVVGVLSVLFAAFVGGPLVSPTDNPTPLAITGTAGALLLLAGWLALGRLGRQNRTELGRKRTENRNRAGPKADGEWVRPWPRHAMGF